MRLCNIIVGNEGPEHIGVFHQGQIYLLHELVIADDCLRQDLPYPPPPEYAETEEFQDFVTALRFDDTLTDFTIAQLDALCEDIRGMKAKAFKLVQAYRPQEVEFQWPVANPIRFRDFYAFEAHVLTARAKRGLGPEPSWYEFPAFYYGNNDGLLAHQEALHAPTHGQYLDFELEVGCILKGHGVDLPPEEAETLIAGYTVLNDWSLRDVQAREMKIGLGPAKAKDFATSFGPYLVTPDELGDRRSGKGYDLVMTARVNGREVSRGNWKDIHYSFAEMIARASQGAALYPGDLLGSGTVGTGCLLEVGTHFPDGAPIGSGVDGWLGPGDVVELEVERLGVLRTEIVQYNKESDAAD